VKIKALQDLHRDTAAGALIGEMAQSAPPDSDAARLAGILQASIVASNGHPEKAMAVFDNVINTSTDDEALAYAWACKAASLYSLQKFEPAALAYLHVPVFYPDVRLLMPDVLIGTAKCYIHIDHLPDAEIAFNDVIARYPNSPQADVAKTELKKIVKPTDATASPTPTPASATDAGSTPAPGASASPAGTPAAQ
jgi:tetratricopeptide (TPR) repeat protein